MGRPQAHTLLPAHRAKGLRIGGRRSWTHRVNVLLENDVTAREVVRLRERAVPDRQVHMLDLGAPYLTISGRILGVLRNPDDRERAVVMDIGVCDSGAEPDVE